MYPIKKSYLNIPSFLWNIYSRIEWNLNNVAQLETETYMRKRAREFLSKLDLNSDV